MSPIGGAAGADKVSIKRFRSNAQFYLGELERDLRNGTFQRSAIRRVHISKDRKKTRPTGIPTVKDRIVQTALKMVLGPIFEKEFSPTSYGFRPGLGCKDALREVDQLLKEDCTWVVDADVRSYFDTIPHDLLINRLREKVSNGYKMIRYADHWAVLCRSLAEAQAALSLIQSWISQNGLQLSPEKTHIGNSHKTGHG